MGGAAAGELASAMAVDVVLDELRERWTGSDRDDPEAFALALVGATEEANTQIHRFATEHPEHRGMGTTATIAGLLRDTLYLVQVGDSRAYLVRRGVAHQITKDQSLMQKLIEAGEITAEEAEHSERRNIILQALGPESVVRTDLTHQLVRRGDTLVLCSDGLSGQMKVEDIARAMVEEPRLEMACARLIDLANDNGGPDNITIVAARFEGSGVLPATDEDPIGHTVFLLAEDATPAVPMERFVSATTAEMATPTPPDPVRALITTTPLPATRPSAAAAARATHANRGTPVLVVVGLVALAALAALAAYRYMTP
jgi:protein phosphatase